MLAERLREGGSLLHGAGDIAGDSAQVPGLALLGEDVEALDERQAGVDHGGELTEEDRHLLVLDLAPDPDRGLAASLLADLGDEDRPPSQLAHRRHAVRGLDLSLLHTGRAAGQ